MEATTDVKETTYSWDDAPEGLRKICVWVHATALRTQTSKVHRLMELGRPKFVIGEKPDGSKYCRIHADSAEVMKVITREYLDKA
jgi:hypothetical protein